jgi:hypothetical protein
MSFLVLAVLFTFTVHRRITATDEGRVAPAWRLLTALVSTVLWLGVALGGRAIGYVTTAAPPGGP